MLYSEYRELLVLAVLAQAIAIILLLLTRNIPVTMLVCLDYSGCCLVTLNLTDLGL